MVTRYTLTLENKSQNSGNMCVYQTYPEAGINLLSLAWFSKPCNPGTRLKVRWDIQYAFVWSETGRLAPGVEFDASQVVNCDPSNINNNATLFTKEFGAYNFRDAPKPAPAGCLGIYTDGLVPHGLASIGIAMSDRPAVACQATLNYTFPFTPHPRYWVAFGNFVPSEVIDVNAVTNPVEIIFPPNVFGLAVTLDGKNEWGAVTPSSAA